MRTETVTDAYSASDKETQVDEEDEEDEENEETNYSSNSCANEEPNFGSYEKAY